MVNPLASGKRTHKLIAMYMTLGEISPHNRSSVDPTQLVLLCREGDFKSFGQEKVFCRLVADLKDLEDSGFQLQDGSNLKASLIAICEDNLGSHGVGGFTENFSTSKHFCRYCLIDRETFVKSPLAFGPQRTPENYNDSVQQLTPDQNVIDGIKFDSCFN